MIGQFDFSQKGWVSGKGRTAIWRDIPWEEKRIEPQYAMSLRNYLANGRPGPKAPFMPIGSSTNSRTGISSYLSNFPAGNSVAFYQPPEQTAAVQACLLLSAFFSSVVYDFPLRQRLGGLNLNDFVMSETVLYLRHAARDTEGHRAELAAQLTLPAAHFSPEWLALRRDKTIRAEALRWALTETERLRCIAILEALHAHIFGFSVDDLHWLLRDCDHSPATLRDNFTAKLDPKGFWRVDKQREPELRHTVLAQVAFADLQAQGLDAFLAGPTGDGWQLPRTLRLADYGLGHDDRAKEPQPVAARLGPRFLPWQLEKDAATSWAECEAHAAQLDALWRHARSSVRSEAEEIPESAPAAVTLREEPTKHSVSTGQPELPLG
jgi:hypothetical protein